MAPSKYCNSNFGKNLLLLLWVVFLSSSCHYDNNKTRLPSVHSKAFDLSLKAGLEFDVDTIGVDQLKKRFDEFILLDAREAEEFKISRLPGARLIGFKNPKWEILDSIQQTDTLLTYCSIGFRSEKIAQELKDRGYIVYNLYGSIFEWVNRNYPIVDSQNNITKQVHGYDRIWSKFIRNKEVEIVY